MNVNKAVINVMGSVTVYITNSGDMTVGDVKKWIDTVSDLGIPDDTRLDSSTLKLTYRAPHVSKISCGDCLPANDHDGFTVFGTECPSADKKED